MKPTIQHILNLFGICWNNFKPKSRKWFTLVPILRLTFVNILELFIEFLYFTQVNWINIVSAASYLQNVHINLRAIDDVAAYYSNCSQLSELNKTAWAIKALQLTDLTTLAGDDTASNVRRLCIRAANPFTEHELQYLDKDVKDKIHTAAVCVYPSRVRDAYEALNSIELGRQIEIAAGIIRIVITLDYKWKN